MDHKKQIIQVLKIYRDFDWSIEPIGGGASHKTFLGNSDSEKVVLKICDNDWSDLPEFEKGFELEAPLTRTINEKTSIPVPQILKYDNSKEDFDFKYIIMEKVDGEPMYEHFNFPKNKKNIEKTGKTLAKLHNSFELEASGSLKIENGEIEVEKLEWRKMFKQLIWGLTSALENRNLAETRDRIRNIAEKNLELLDSRPSCLVHQEVSPRNMLGGSENINALIDWERSISGDPEYDLATAEKHLTQRHDGRAERRENADEVKETLFKAYKQRRETSEEWGKRRYLYHLPYLCLMIYITTDKDEEINSKLETQLRNVEEKLV